MPIVKFHENTTARKGLTYSKMTKYILLCENSDKFAVQRPLPPIEYGDILLVHDAGAHCYAMSHNYNGRLRCAEILRKEDGSLQMIRRAERPEDYFATLL